VTTTRDIDAAKDRIVDSLTTARDASAAALEEIVPAIASAVEAARDASGPLYAEAAHRASNAMSALRDSDAATSISESRAASVLTRKSRPRRRWPIVVAGLGVGAAVLTFAKRRQSESALIDVTEAAPSSHNAASPHVADTATTD
jgi:hypothetical protein